MPFKRRYLGLISTRSKKLEEFDELAMEALEQRKRRYEEWETRKLNPAPPNNVQWLRSKPRSSPAPTESTMVAAYDRAGQRGIPLLRLPISSDPFPRHGGQKICQHG